MTVTQTTVPSGNSYVIKTTMDNSADRAGFYFDPPRASTDTSQLIVQADVDDGKIIIEYSVMDDPKEEDFINLKDPNGRINQRAYSSSEVIQFKHYRSLRARMDAGGTGGTLFLTSDQDIRSVHSDSPAVTLETPTSVEAPVGSGANIEVSSSINNKLLMWSAESSDSSSVTVGEVSFLNDYAKVVFPVTRTTGAGNQTVTITATPIYGADSVTATVTVTA